MPGHATEDFHADLEAVVPNLGLWASSGWSTVTPIPDTVCGVGAFFGPPLAAPDATLRIRLAIDGVELDDQARPGGGQRGLLAQGGRWEPGCIRREGTYHYLRDGRLLSLAVRSELVPLRDATGYALTITVENRGAEAIDVAVVPTFDPGGPRHVPLGDWAYTPPTAGPAAEPVGPSSWRAGSVVLTLTAPPDRVAITPGGEGELCLTVTAALGPVEPVPAPETTKAWWERTVEKYLAAVPTLTSDIEGLEAYYRRSLASGLVCLWDNPDFAMTPFPATSGLDGGAMCAYVWDTCGYAPNVLTQLLGPATTEVVDLLTAIDLDRHYAAAPDGSGLGVGYAYSPWSLVRLVQALAAHGCVDAELVSRTLAVFERFESGRSKAGELVDFGTQENLLEMRTAGWEHVVPSPNAERAWSLRALAELADLYAPDLPAADLRRRAERIEAAVVSELWDPGHAWWRCVYPDGRAESVYSIQAFDVLRAGVGSEAIVEAVLSHVRDGAFLGRYGVSSVSAEDRVHYETGDPDWSGSGAYEGEATTLALTLWELRRPDLAWDVLGRLLWKGGHMPYFPQEQYCHRPVAPPAHKRMNVIAGLGGAEAILAGPVGLRPRPDGSLWFDPQPVPAGGIEIRGYGFRGRVVDVTVAPDACQARVDGTLVYEGRPAAVRVI
jgi:hypothetical protein